MTKDDFVLTVAGDMDLDGFMFMIDACLQRINELTSIQSYCMYVRDKRLILYCNGRIFQERRARIDIERLCPGADVTVVKEMIEITTKRGVAQAPTESRIFF